MEIPSLQANINRWKTTQIKASIHIYWLAVGAVVEAHWIQQSAVSVGGLSLSMSIPWAFTVGHHVLVLLSSTPLLPPCCVLNVTCWPSFHGASPTARAATGPLPSILLASVKSNSLLSCKHPLQHPCIFCFPWIWAVWSGAASRLFVSLRVVSPAAHLLLYSIPSFQTDRDNGGCHYAGEGVPLLRWQQLNQ